MPLWGSELSVASAFSSLRGYPDGHRVGPRSGGRDFGSKREPRAHDDSVQGSAQEPLPAFASQRERKATKQQENKDSLNGLGLRV